MKNQSASEALHNFGKILIKVLLVGVLVYFIFGIDFKSRSDSFVETPEEAEATEVADVLSLESSKMVEDPKVYLELNYTSIARQKMAWQANISLLKETLFK